MASEILHGTWLPEQRQFFLWGESPTQARRKGRRPAVAQHPFQASSERLLELLALFFDDVSAVRSQRKTIWLPSLPGVPLVSPTLRATGALDAVPNGQPVLAPWSVTGLLLSAASAVDLLLDLPLQPQLSIGDDLRAWRLAALLALELVAQQQVMPALRREAAQLWAAWQIVPAPAQTGKLAALARGLPALCRAVVDSPQQAQAPAVLLEHFVETAADALVRELGYQPRLRPTTPGGSWLQALLGPDSLLRLPPAQAEQLYALWEQWAATAHIAGDAAMRISFRLEPPEQAQAPWRLAYLLQATDDPSLLVPAARIWSERGATLHYLQRRFERPQERLLTGLAYAARLFPPLEPSLRQPAPERAELSAEQAFGFLKEAAPLLEQSGFGVLVPAWWQRGARLTARGHVRSGRAPANEQGYLNFQRLVSFEWQLTLAGERIDRREFEQLVALKQPLVQLRGQWVVLDPDELRRAAAFFEQHSGQLSALEALRLGLSQDGARLPAGVEFEGLEVEGWLGQLLERLGQPQALELLPPPAGLRGQLRPYQQRGYSWLAFLRQYGLGACLADDMGLGKSIQTLCLLLHERERLGVREPALLVCPTSVVGNWVRELQRFAPALRPLVHRGAERQQGPALAHRLDEYDLLLTSYQLLARDSETLAALRWSTVVLDEAQNIKNPSTKQAQAARALQAGFRVALTGTPVENRLSELWSIINFLNPGYLGSEQAFRREFARPIERTGDQQAREQLRALTAPLILRRLKSDPAIISDLPEKLEMKVYCSLSAEQATLYEAVVRDALAEIEQADEQAQEQGSQIRRRGLVLAMLLKLKQVCNHPALLLQDRSALEGRSGKLQRLAEMLEEVYAEDDRALVFTQFASLGQLLQPYLRSLFADEVLFLHGGTPPQERDLLVRRFQSPGGPRVFILSLKAGGTGLNLTAANHVFHFDRWWNPAVEDQATDRAFRIGQRRNVQVHKFICGGTLEEHIDEMIEGKRNLARSVLGADESWLTDLSTAQLRELVALRHAEALEV